ncbi:MAG: transglutaminase family protein [Pseudonocardiales bacterium]|nr:transglutaminase family protein [Pseudonocardiales bacterium]
MAGTLQLSVGCDFRFNAPASVAAVFQVEPTRDARHRLLSETLTTTPTQPRWSYQDSFGNTCSRLLMPEGPFGLGYHALVEVPDAIDDIDLDARELPIDAVPDTVLMYLLPSRFCVSDVMANQAWEMFGSLAPGWRRVQAIVDAVHDHLTFGYGTSSPTLTAQEAYESAKGVCRDFAHVAITFCRALNIPARYVFGYLPDIEVPIPDAPMDFCAWMEVWLDGRWWTFDPRNNQHRKGRVVIGRGRDAVDVAMVTTYGFARLDEMTVVAEPAA